MAFITKEISNGARDTVVVASGDMAPLNGSRTSGTRRGRAVLYRAFAKRALDVALVLLTAPVWLPLVVLGAALVMLDGHNPFYSQERLGLNGRVFRIWKLRSMVPDADVFLERYLSENPEARAEWDATQKLKNDPRITVVGRVLRKMSLDELPQLFNVLIGDMSLVGPRPIMLTQKTLYPGRTYYKMRPGLTGFWQVSDRNECSFVERVQFDDAYHRSMCFGTDMGVLMRTVGVVFRATGY
jgi:exopolysaccharide production protein ExoY